MATNDELPKKVTKIQTGSVTEISPHNKAVYEAGKTMLVDSITTGRQFCQFMITTSAGAIPIYLGVLAFILPKNYALGMLIGIMVAMPAIIFLIASVVFAIGFLPVVAPFSLDIVEEIEKERNKIIQHRSRLIKIGFSTFVLGSFLAIIVMIVTISTR
jgi:hypothetical protein